MPIYTQERQSQGERRTADQAERRTADQAYRHPKERHPGSRNQNGQNSQQNHRHSTMSNVCSLIIVACLISSLAAFSIIASNAATTSADNQPGSSAEGSGSTTDVLTTLSDDDATSEIPTEIQNDDSLTQVASREITHDLVITNSNVSLADTQAYAEFAEAIGSIEDRGYDVSAIVIDINSGATLSYNATEEYYCASSIKAAFVCFLYEDLVDGGSVSLNELTPLTTQTIIDSDNVCYANLRRAYENMGFASWLEAIGCGYGRYDSYEDIASSTYYPYLDVTQLSSIWQHIYTYLTTKNTPASEELAELLASRTSSAIADALGDTYETWGKAGWYPADGYNLDVTVDAGVVLADQPYIVVVMTDDGDDFDAITPVFSALDALHDEL